MTIESFLEGHVRAFEWLGGVPRECVYDNLRSAVARRERDVVTWNPRFVELRGHYRLPRDRLHPGHDRVEGARRGPSAGGRLYGTDSVANDVFATVPENFQQFSADAEEWIDAADYLVVTGPFSRTSKSGAAVDVPFAHLWTMREGKAARFQNLVDREQWTQAWGG